MLPNSLFSAAAFFTVIFASAIPTPTVLARRKEDANLPTFTLGPLDQYAPKASASQPSGDSLQIYPTGIVERAPEDGIDVAFGPDLNKRISTAVEANCKDNNPENCRSAIMPVVQSTDVSHHSKRFLFMLIGAGLALIIAEMITLYVMSNKPPPEVVHFGPSDLHQIENLGNANTVAIETYVAQSTSIATITVTQTPTPTANEFITVETLTADSGEHKVGDVVYRIPPKIEGRLKDLLGILGAESEAKKCEGSKKRADVAEECARAIRNTAEALFNAAPEGALAVARQNLPQRPAPGGALRLPVQNFVLVEVPVVVILAHRLVPMQVVEEFDGAGLAQAALAVTLAAHALMFAGSTLLEVWIPKDELADELKEEDLTCPKDLICVDESCAAQEEDKEIAHRDAVCKEGSQHAACKCKRVTHPYVQMVPKDYMDKQYEWLDELIRVSEGSAEDSKLECTNEKTDLEKGADTFSGLVVKACAGHEELKKRGELAKRGEPWLYTETINGYSWGLVWDDKGDCPFNCYDVFQSFVTEDDKCVSQNSIQKNGLITSKCGDASYFFYPLGEN